MRFVTRCEGRELRYSTLRLACRELNAPPNVYANVEIELEGRGIFYKNGLGFLKNQIQLFDEGALFSWSIHPNLIPYLFEDGSDFDRFVYRRNKYLTKILVEQKSGNNALINVTKLFFSKNAYSRPFHFELRTNITAPAKSFSQTNNVTDQWEQEGF